MNPKEIIFIDIETDGTKILDLGAVSGDGKEFHGKNIEAFASFVDGYQAICGHNILRHDLKYLSDAVKMGTGKLFIDTLYLSPLLFPKKPYHKLLKDDKIATDELNNPLNDAKKARDLFFDEVTAFQRLEAGMQRILFNLLRSIPEFRDFFRFLGYKSTVWNLSGLVGTEFAGKICTNAPIRKLAGKYPVELAYALALVGVIEHDSITPPWVLKNYPRVENVLHFLRSRKCASCPYCDKFLDEIKGLQRFFQYDSFRSYGGKPLQQEAVKAAVAGKSILAVFPTGGGKSITFQLPALMAGANEKGLTVVISPLQSLMKDQTDNLEWQHNITEAVTINGSLDPFERSVAFERVESGAASLLYISPESLRSRSIEGLLLGRNIVRFVIDEAHCFSAWGQDFRVDYLYIGDFIKRLQQKKEMPHNIPISCFTATAKQQVIADIQAYFDEKLSQKLEVFQAGASRVNLSYHIFGGETPDEKDQKLRSLLFDHDCPTIIYVSRTKRAELLAEKLCDDGFSALPYHGKMDKQIRIENQEAFMQGNVQIIVATTAFGMGVDKKDVGMVIHYDISDSLENYVQEAGRAGRDEAIRANCFVLFCDEDLNKHFNLLNQSRMSQKEIQQVWKGIKDLTKTRMTFSQSALEIARKAGWDDSVLDMETRVKTAINALEQSGFVRRGQNMPRIFADSILVKNMEEARQRIDKSTRFDDDSREQAIRIISNLISAKSKSRGRDNEGESRVDYISDRLGIVKADVIRVIGLLREERILADAKDLVVFIRKNERKNRAKATLNAHLNTESFLYEVLSDEEKSYHIKELNESLQSKFPTASINHLRSVLNYLSIKRFLKQTKEYNKNYVTLRPYFPIDEIRRKTEKRRKLSETIIDYLYEKAQNQSSAEDCVSVEFSVLQLKEEFDHNILGEIAKPEEIEDALYYLMKIGAMKVEGGFLVVYQAMQIERLERDNRALYKKEHYEKLEQYYQNKRQQIHIVGEYAKRLIQDYNDAMEFVDDYFMMDYDLFIRKYFRGRTEEIKQNITPQKFRQLFGELSPAQLNIINDQQSDCIVVAAGPGSGKTKLLTHKLASLFMMEDVKHEQLLMLTFSRAAATEFKLRLMRLIGNAANFIQITTFHSYCFDLLGRVGDIEKSDGIISNTVEKTKAGEVELSRLTKTVLVIDEAQDMSKAEYNLVKVLKDCNPEMRIIAVGDDDQNIYEFRGSSSEYFISLATEPGAKKVELVDNYRSCANIVEFANRFAVTLSHRFKSQPILSVNRENGEIVHCKLRSGNVVIPAVKLFLKQMPSGTTGILTRTNEEAMNIAALLQEEGVSAKIVQSNSGFNLANLVELRDFLEMAGIGKEGYTISREDWENAVAQFRTKYAASQNLQEVLKLLHDFDATHNKTKFKSDLKQFVRESKAEDFVPEQKSAILISTIHQSKGREFDNVFLALSPFPKADDATLRAIYVAITRAKQNLYILTNGSYFDNINAENLERYTDNVLYPEPARISLQLTLKDVNLGYFAGIQKRVDSLMSGQEITVKDSVCYWQNQPILRFSNAFSDRMKLLKQKGYAPVGGTIRYIVYWQGKDCDCEVKTVLPIITLKKEN